MKRRSFLATGTAGLLGLAHAIHANPAAAGAPLEVTPTHPRLLITDQAELRAGVDRDPQLRRWYQDHLAAADRLLDVPPVEYEIVDDLRMLSVSREVVFRVHTLSFVHAVEGGTTYRDRLWTEMAAVSAFPDWNDHRHFLDTAEMSHAVSIAYDWWYDQWSPEQRATMETAILDFGLRPGLADYRSGGGWPERTTNWNIVCNAGMVVAALALADREPTLTQQIIDHAMASLPRAVEVYAPDGAYVEGIDYWGYATKYLVLLIAALESATGAPHELASAPGVDSTVDFPLHLTGPTGMPYNYYDSASGAPQPPEVFWLARRFGRPDHAWWAAQGAETQPPSWEQTALSLLWADSTITTGPVAAGTAYDSYFRKAEVATMRSGWERSDAIFVGGKAGDNSTDHGDLDIGSFVLDGLGQRWLVDLGKENYSLPDYWGPSRWTYYRKRAEGHNTLVVEPGSTTSPVPDQDPTATGAVVGRHCSPDQAWFVVDGSDTSAAITSWHRGWWLRDHRQVLLVQDEVALAEPGVVWWFAHSAADIVVDADGRRAVLSRAGQDYVAQLVGPDDAEFMIMKSEPLWTSPNPDGQTSNPGVDKLFIRLPVSAPTTIGVQFHPSWVEPRSSDLIPLEEWPTSSEPVATLSSLTVAGKPVTAFSPTNFSYGLDPDELTDVVAVPEGTDARARVIPGRHGRPTRVVVTRPGHRAGRYLLWPYRPLGLGNFPTTIIASTDDGNKPENTMDGRLDTRWSAEGDGQWIAYDMGDDGPVDTVRIAWHAGTTRQGIFDIEVAADGASEWQRVHSGRGSGQSNELEEHSFDPVSARYLRIVGHGNSANGWNSITEVVIDGRDVDVEQVVRLDSLALDVAPAIAIGESAPTTTTGELSDGSSADLSDLTRSYLSNTPEVASVSEDGVVTGVAAGRATIAVVGNTPDRRQFHATAAIEVTDPDRPTLITSADTYVRDGEHADRAHGTEDVMWVKKVQKPDSGYSRVALFSFTPDPIDRTVELAELSIVGRVSDSGGDTTEIVLFLATGAVDEATTTWNNRPEGTSELQEVHRFTVTSEEATHTADLTGPLAPLIEQGEPLTIVVDQRPVTGDGLLVALRTRESDSGAPRLQLALTPR